MPQSLTSFLSVTQPNIQKETEKLSMGMKTSTTTARENPTGFLLPSWDSMGFLSLKILFL